MNKKQYDMTSEGGTGTDWDTNVGGMLYTKDGSDTPEKKESALTIYHWLSIAICITMMLVGVRYNDWLIAMLFLITGYFEIRTALLYHDIRQLQDKVKALENSQNKVPITLGDTK